jgi:hypothetical protein
MPVTKLIGKNPQVLSQVKDVDGIYLPEILSDEQDGLVSLKQGSNVIFVNKVHVSELLIMLRVYESPHASSKRLSRDEMAERNQAILEALKTKSALEVAQDFKLSDATIYTVQRNANHKKKVKP